MNKKIKKIQKKIVRATLLTRNIVINGSKELFSRSESNKFKRLLYENRFLIIASTIIAVFICKNVYTILTYDSEIKTANKEIKQQIVVNKQLKEDLKYYKTDEFILRYAIEELNLRPTKESNLFHGEVLPVKEDDSDPKETSSVDNKPEDSTVENDKNEESTQNKNDNDDQDPKTESSNENNEQSDSEDSE